MTKTTTTKTERFEMRAAPRFLRLLDNWRRQQEIIPSRAEAICLLCERQIGYELSQAPAETRQDCVNS